MPVGYSSIRRGAFFRERRQLALEQGEKLYRPASATLDFEAITAPDNLVKVFKWLMYTAGTATGPDRVRFTEPGRSEVWRLMVALSSDLRNGIYRLGDAKRIGIPRPGRKPRFITIRELFDRVVSAALQSALRDILDAQFLPGSHGFRPGRGVLTLLAQLAIGIRLTGYHWIVNDDIRNAFDSVPRQFVLDCHRPLVSCPRLLSLLEIVLQANAAQPVGLDQGGSYSPTAFNLSSHKLLDQEMGLNLLPLWFRYADNLAYLCPSEAKARDTRRNITTLLATQRLELKGPEPQSIIDLRERSTPLLGFTLRTHDDDLILTVDETAWDELRAHLIEAYQDGCSPTAVATQLCQQWARVYGPGLKDPDCEARRIIALLREHGIRESLTKDAVARTILQSHSDWDLLLQSTSRVYSTDSRTFELRDPRRSRVGYECPPKQILHVRDTPASAGTVVNNRFRDVPFLIG